MPAARADSVTRMTASVVRSQGTNASAGTAAMATPPALSASEVLSQVRNVRSLARVNRGSGSMPVTIFRAQNPWRNRVSALGAGLGDLLDVRGRLGADLLGGVHGVVDGLRIDPGQRLGEAVGGFLDRGVGGLVGQLVELRGTVVERLLHRLR